MNSGVISGLGTEMSHKIPVWPTSLSVRRFFVPMPKPKEFRSDFWPRYRYVSQNFCKAHIPLSPKFLHSWVKNLEISGLTLVPKGKYASLTLKYEPRSLCSVLLVLQWRETVHIVLLVSDIRWQMYETLHLLAHMRSLQQDKVKSLSSSFLRDLSVLTFIVRPSVTVEGSPHDTTTAVSVDSAFLENQKSFHDEAPRTADTDANTCRVETCVKDIWSEAGSVCRRRHRLLNSHSGQQIGLSTPSENNPLTGQYITGGKTY